MNKILLVIDMQNDFVTGALGTAEAQAIVPAIKNKIAAANESGNTKIVFTRDTHTHNYLSTMEGQYLPVEHCIKGTPGWCIIEELYHTDYDTIDKPTFGYAGDWSEAFKYNQIDEIEIVGVCTDICVITNSLILKTLYPNTHIVVDASCCAGVTPEKHVAALEVMKSCQIDVIGE